MAILINMHTPDRRHLSRVTSRSWGPDEHGWFSWGSGHYRIDPDYFERRPYRPFWHFMFPFMLLTERPERFSVHYMIGDPQPRNMHIDPVLDNLVTTGTATGIHRERKQTTINDFTFPRKSSPIMMLLIFSILGNVILAIAVALKSISL